MKNMTLGAKLGTSFGVLVLMIVLIVGIYHSTVTSVRSGFGAVIDHEIEIAMKAKQVKEYMLQCRRNEKDFQMRLDSKYMASFDESITALKKNAEEITPIAKEAGLTEVVQLVEKIMVKADVYDSTFDKMHASWVEKGLDQNSGVYGEFRTATHELEAIYENLNDDHTMTLLLSIRRNEKDYMLRGEEKYVTKTRDSIASLVDYSKRTYDGAVAAQIVEKSNLYSEKFNRMVELTDRIAEEVAVLRDAVHEIETEVDLIEEAAVTAQADSTLQISKVAAAKAMLALIIGIVTGVLGIILAVVITRAITVPLGRIVQSLSDSADQVSSASGQISSSSQQLAEGSAEQASSLEEISSSMEQMSGMTNNNADNAETANNTMIRAKDVVEEAGSSLRNMIVSIEEIQTNSQETEKIIKSIDEIAFQTNLLALNAAVEAARAGEAGKGFAVVAEEVRNLAQRAGEAARNTSELIEGTITSVRQGVDVSKKASEKFDEQAEYSQKIAQLLAEISAASREQAQGIQQVNTGISQMDKVTQQNASNAEESASASEEMNSQAEVLAGIVGELSGMIGGAAGAAKQHVAASAVATRKKPVRHYDTTVMTRKQQTVSEKKAPQKSRAVEKSAVESMDEDFMEF